MKLQKKNRPLYKNPLSWLVILVILALTLVALEKTQVTNFINTPTAEDAAAQRAEQKKADQTKKQEFIEKAPEATPVAPPQSSDAITLTATQEADSVTILTKLKDFSAGTCELSVVNGQKTHVISAEVIYQPEFSSCAGFGVPLAQLGTGQWSITLKATPSGGSALIKTITLEVK